MTVSTFPANGTPVQFLAAVADMTIDVIEMEVGTRSNWFCAINIDRTARPLLVRPAVGAAVVWDNTGSMSGDGIFYFGFYNKGKAAYITFDPAGTGGSFTIQNVRLVSTGLVCTAWVDQITFNGFKVRGCTAAAGATGWQEHTVYVSSDGVHRSSNVTFNDWDTNSGDGTFNPDLQVYNAPSCDGVTALRWKSDGTGGARKGCTVESGATNVLIDGWTWINLLMPFIAEGVAGTIRNCHATGSGPPEILAPMVDGGGNVWDMTDHPISDQLIAITDSRERHRIKARAFAALSGQVGRSVTRGVWKVTLTSAPTFTNDLLTFSVRIERAGVDVTPPNLNPIRVHNPPILVDDPTGDILTTATDRVTGAMTIRALRENLPAALLGIVRDLAR